MRATTGYSTSLWLIGLPDAGLVTMTEMHLNARHEEYLPVGEMDNYTDSAGHQPAKR
jgi:hypothetical protein